MILGGKFHFQRHLPARRKFFELNKKKLYAELTEIRPSAGIKGCPTNVGMYTPLPWGGDRGDFHQNPPPFETVRGGATPLPAPLP